jgi:hypothetical protein
VLIGAVNKWLLAVDSEETSEGDRFNTSHVKDANQNLWPAHWALFLET